MRPIKLSLIAALSVMFAGCATTQVSEPNLEQDSQSIVDRNLQASADRIEAMMVELKKIHMPDKPIGDGELITMRPWSGDAAQLVESLAKARGKKFDALGSPKLPLPVTIEAENAEYDDVLAKIAAQITHRAALVIEDDRILIHYRLKDTVK